MSKRSPATISLNFNARQTHNKFDCEPEHRNGRYGMNRRVDLRISLIIDVFGQTPTGYTTISALVERLNRMHKSAHFTYADVYPTIRKMMTVGLVVEKASGWSLGRDARAKYDAAIAAGTLRIRDGK